MGSTSILVRVCISLSMLVLESMKEEFGFSLMLILMKIEAFMVM